MTPPGKWFLARVGVLTGLLGLGTGWMLFSTPGPGRLDVPEADAFVVECPGYRVQSEGVPVLIPGTPTCQVSASFPEGGASSGSVRVNSGETSVCRRAGDQLRCAP